MAENVLLYDSKKNHISIQKSGFILILFLVSNEKLTHVFLFISEN